MSNPDQPANHLRDESSPYLLQHAHNPVNWYPWGEEALERARREDKPILLSIGYAACHWCHVMERESFENAAIARQMNEHFVSIKVDREERPDLDDIYMRSVQMMSGHGGWPLTVFLTPDLEPFAGGTYFPPEDRPHMPGFPRVLEHIAHTWSHQRDKAVEVGNLLTSRLGGEPQSQGAIEQLDHEMLHRAAMELHDRFDPNHGGFGPAPKFPNTTWVTLLLRYAHAHHDDDLLTDATFTLDSIAAGGIRDHVGGGFHRYATDARWLIPHFEKMLYDNALLVVAYLDALQITGDPRHGRAAATALDWVRREMQAPDGGYYSTLDADSEGVEGKYYVWDRAEIVDLLGADAEAFCNAYGVVDGGNWEGVNILHHPRPLGLVAAELEIEESQLRERLASCLDRLRASRDGRVRPALDDKVLADWNGMMIAAMARAYRVLDRPDFLASAIAAATFVCEKMMPEGRLLHAHRHGKSYLKAYLDDYATMLWACVELFESTFDPHWLAQARTFADGLLDLFADDEAGGFFFTGRDHEALIARLRAAQDGATPSGNAIAATWLQRLAVLSGDQRYDDAARDTLSAFAATLRRAPFAFAQLLIALDQQLAEPSEIVVVGDASSDRVREALRTLWRRYSPTTAVVLFDPLSESAGAMAAALPLLEGKAEAGSDPATPTFFRCRGYSCEPPTDDLQAILG